LNDYFGVLKLNALRRSGATPHSAFPEQLRGIMVRASGTGSPSMISYKEMLADANAAVPRLTPAQSKEMIASGNVLVVDVRDGTEVAQTGRLKGAVHVARGSLEGRADPDAPSYNPAFKRDQPVLLHCAGGGRAALAGKTLKDMGYTKVFNGGGFKELADAGIEVEKP